MTNSSQGINDFIPWISYSDDGIQWSEPVCPWTEIINKRSVFGSVRRTLDGRICFAGISTPIKKAGEAFWSDEAGGMLENKLVYSLSCDGYSFSDLIEIDLPYYASAENPGGMLVEEDGTMRILYSPYPTIEKKEPTEVNRMVIVSSKDGGKSFIPQIIGEQPHPCQYAEAWLIKLTNGKYFVSTWQTATESGTDKYLLSDDVSTFSPPISLPFNGQSTACEPWNDGKVFVIYNQRRQEPRGVWLAAGRPNEDGFNMIANEPIWLTETATKSNSSGSFENWTDFAFGEPHVTLLSDGNLLCTLWYESDGKSGVRYVKLSIEE
jgi:hypothetical protein